MLDTVPSNPDARSSAARRNARPGIFGRRCAREVAAIVDSANALANNRLWDRSLARHDLACALQPSDPALIQNKLGVAIRARPSDLSRIMAIAEKLWAHPSLDPSLEAASRTLVGDELWRLGDSAGARVQFARAAALPLGPPTRRAAMIRLRAITDTALAALLKPYYADKDVGLAQVFRMSDALERRPNDAVLSYLVGRELVLRGADDKGATLLERADAIGLGDPVLALDNLRNLVVARANRNLCAEAERGRVRLRAAGGSATDDAVAANRVARCQFAVARGWLPLQ